MKRRAQTTDLSNAPVQSAERAVKEARRRVKALRKEVRDAKATLKQAKKALKKATKTARKQSADARASDEATTDTPAKGRAKSAPAAAGRRHTKKTRALSVPRKAKKVRATPPGAAVAATATNGDTDWTEGEWTSQEEGGLSSRAADQQAPLRASATRTVCSMMRMSCARLQVWT